jgi:hypothetical protein
MDRKPIEDMTRAELEAEAAEIRPWIAYYADPRRVAPLTHRRKRVLSRMKKRLKSLEWFLNRPVDRKSLTEP